MSPASPAPPGNGLGTRLFSALVHLIDHIYAHVGHHCWRMRVVPREFVHVRILSVYFPVVCPYMIVILTSGSMALYETCRDFAVEYSLTSLI